jgi:uncharacterized protein YqgV (UPF0045/DUF77 family)
MTTRTFTTKSGTVFEWEETNEVLEALKQIHQQQQPVPPVRLNNTVV